MICLAFLRAIRLLNHEKIIFSLMILIGTQISGCSLFSKDEVTIKPIPCTIHIAANDSMNLDKWKRASPTVISIYQLKANQKFESGDFYSLYQAPNKSIGQDLIDVKQIIIRPGEVTHLYLTIWPNTQFLGVLVAYRKISDSKWYSTLPVDHTLKRMDVSLLVGTQRMSFQVVSKLRGHNV